MRTYTAYQIVFNALIKAGYEENEAEEILCQVIQDQIDYTDFADRIHKIIEETKNTSYLS